MRSITVILLTLGLARASYAQTETSKKLDDLLSAYANTNQFHGSVLVAKQGQVILQKGYGTKTNGQFQIYSITKTFTATLVLQLAEEKKLSIDDKLSRYYPGFPEGDSITIRHLLSHTSGLYDYTHGNDMPDMREQTLVGFLARKPLDFAPGTNWSYSNSGYYLLGYIIQRVTNMRYEDAIQQYIFDRVKMDKSGFDFKSLVSADKIIGYAKFNSREKKPAIMYEAPGPFAAGAIYSTVGDLYKYHKALQKGTILSTASMQIAHKPVRNNYGLGWITSEFDGHKVVGHSGGAAGFRSNFIRIPAMDICIILLSNTESANLDQISRKILTILFHKPYQLPVERYPLSETALHDFTGTYSNDTFHLYIRKVDGRLVAQPAGQQPSVLLAQNKTSFYVDDIDGNLVFKNDSSNCFTAIVLQRNGLEKKFKRIFPGWGLVGNASPVGWEGKLPDLPLTEDPNHKGRWIINNIVLQSGHIKFRFDNDWTINYGDDDADGKPDADGADINVLAGRYNILLDLSDEENPRYVLDKLAP